MSNNTIVSIALAFVASICCFANAQSSPGESSPGDECTNPLTASIGANAFNTENATTSYPFPYEDESCQALDWGDAGQVQPDIWFTFTTSASGSYNFTTCDSSSYDT